MNRQIRRVGVAILLVFVVTFLNLNWIQVIQAEKLAGDDRNVRVLLKEYSIRRGAIISADAQTVANSVETPDEELKFLRTYPTGPLFAHVAGYYSVVFGRGGLERSHNRDLTGEGGVLTMQELGDRLLGGEREGDTLFLSIDSRLQKAAAEGLGNQKGAVVAIEPTTGQILALVSFPSFDPNPLSSHDSKEVRAAWDALQSDPNKPMLNRAVGEAYPPGSTYKIVTASAAIEHGRGVDTAFPVQSEYLPPQTDKPIGNFGGRSCGGTMSEAFKISCNTFFAQLAAELDQSDFEETAAGFGFEEGGEAPPIDLDARASRFPTRDQLKSPAFRAQSGIGQFNVAATPLGLLLVAAGVANGGEVPVPKLVKEIRDARGTATERAEPEVWRRAISDDTALAVKSLMVSVVAGGTGRGAQISGVPVAGKTGTAETGREGEPPHVWFVAFAPADNPKIAVVVLVENGGDLRDEATGGRVAAPIAKRVIEAHRGIAKW